jgi:hypothetical protein
MVSGVVGLSGCREVARVCVCWVWVGLMATCSRVVGECVGCGVRCWAEVEVSTSAMRRLIDRSTFDPQGEQLSPTHEIDGETDGTGLADLVGQ